METFLKQVAADLYRKMNGDFTKVAVVFPNKRASLFFNEYLAQESDRPVWSPAYVSISELFRQSSQWVTGDSIKLVCDLYKVFREITGSKESLDEFYFWGEMLISDFDDADKNMADTKALFSNLKDLNKLTGEYDFLEEGQKEALSQFFRNFSIEQVTELKRRFISLWDVLGDIYTQYKELLREQGIAYEGMLYLEVTETMDVQQFPYDKYVFVGFNVLNKVEQTLFSCELGRYTAFGIAAQKRVPDSWRQIAFVPDICTNAQQAQRLAQLCTQGQLEPIHLMDVIEDFVADPCSWP